MSQDILGKLLIEHFREAIADIKKRGEQGEPEMPTGLKFIDEVTDGLRKKELWICAGGTSMGKTSLSLQIANNIADRGKRVLYMSLEMSVSELVVRLFANQMRIDNTLLRKGNISFIEGFEYKRKTFEDMLTKWNLDIVEKGFNFDETVEIIEKGYDGVTPDAIFIDFIQLVSWERHDSENIAIMRYIRKLKELAITKNMAVFVVSQYRRQPSGVSKNHDYDLSDLKGSSSLEQTADVVLLVNRKEDGDGMGNVTFDHFIKVAKNRHGELVSKQVNFAGQHYKFMEIL